MSDSLMIKATGKGIERLRQVLELAPFTEAYNVKTQGLSIIFCKLDGDLPEPLNVEAMAQMAMGFLKNPQREYGPQPDIDGHCEKGWSVEASNMTDEICITPHWMIHHK